MWVRARLRRASCYRGAVEDSNRKGHSGLGRSEARKNHGFSKEERRLLERILDVNLGGIVARYHGLARPRPTDWSPDDHGSELHISQVHNSYNATCNGG